MKTLDQAQLRHVDTLSCFAGRAHSASGLRAWLRRALGHGPRASTESMLRVWEGRQDSWLLKKYDGIIILRIGSCLRHQRGVVRWYCSYTLIGGPAWEPWEKGAKSMWP